MTRPAVTARLAGRVAATRFADLPAGAVHAARRSLLDGVGVMLAATGEPGAAANFVALAVDEGGRAEATVIGSRARVHAAAAAFANGALAHTIDFGDGHAQTLVHPHGAVLPAALAVAEATGASGEALLTAIAVGADVAVRCARGLGRDTGESRFYRPALVGPFGAAAAVGSLLGLDEDQVADAWAVALCGAALPVGIKSGGLRGVRDAFAARAGVTAAMLGRRRVAAGTPALEGPGGFLDAFAIDGGDADAMLDALGVRYEGEAVAFKPWPTCGGAHPHIAATLELLGGIARDEVAEVVASVSPLFFDLLCEPADAKRASPTAISAKFSLPFCLGVALARGAVTLDDFAAEALADPAVLAAAAKVRCVRDEALGPLQGRVAIRTAAGWTERMVADVPGGTQRPMDDAALVAKFIGCAAFARPAIDPARARVVAGRIVTLDAGAGRRGVPARACCTQKGGQRMTNRKRIGHWLLGGASMVAASAASAQSSPPATPPAEDAPAQATLTTPEAPVEDAAAAGDIVITGTRIRGIAPVGSAVIPLNRAADRAHQRHFHDRSPAPDPAGDELRRG